MISSACCTCCRVTCIPAAWNCCCRYCAACTDEAEVVLLSVPYGAGKAAIDKITHDTALELRSHQVAVVSLWPGLVLTEGLTSRAVTTPDAVT